MKGVWNRSVALSCLSPRDKIQSWSNPAQPGLLNSLRIHYVELSTLHCNDISDFLHITTMPTDIIITMHEAGAAEGE